MLDTSTKVCPYCSTKIRANDTQCFSCKNKVGPPNRYGIAKKPVNWIGNIMAVLSGGGFIYYLYWLFFLKK